MSQLARWFINSKKFTGKILIVCLIASLALACIGVTALFNYEVLEKGKLLEYTNGTIYKVRIFNKFTLLVEPEHRFTSDVFNSYILTGISFISFTIALIIAFITNEGLPRQVFYMFLTLSIGMFYLAVDEFFGVHESIGHNLRFLAANSIIEHPDDVVVLSYLVPVAAFIYWFRKEIFAVKKALIAFCGVFVFSVFGALMDVLCLSRIVEELSEIIASSLLIVAVILLGLYHIENQINSGGLKKKLQAYYKEPT